MASDSGSLGTGSANVRAAQKCGIERLFLFTFPLSHGVFICQALTPF